MVDREQPSVPVDGVGQGVGVGHVHAVDAEVYRIGYA